jgi:hypothetical protein
MSRLNRHLSICPRLSPILPFVARVAIYFTNLLSRYCLLDLALSLIVITYSPHRMTSHKSHVSEVISDFAGEKGITLFLLPPYSNHLPQPLDQGFCRRIKVQFRQFPRLRDFSKVTSTCERVFMASSRNICDTHHLELIEPYRNCTSHRIREMRQMRA